jgi:hypothetical protein
LKKLPNTPVRTTTGFAFSILDRAIRESFANRKFGKDEKEKMTAFFNTEMPECVFCGSEDIARWDHLVPVRKGGDTVLGNMVLACSRCDDSKQHNDFEEWMRGSNQYSPASIGVDDLEDRINKIKSYVKEFGYSPMDLDMRLNKEERKRLAEITSRLASARKDVEKLSNENRIRKGIEPIYSE